MDDHAIAVLEFPVVLQRLAALTSFSAGREAALALRPLSDLEAVTRRQRQTGEALYLHRMATTASMAGARDVRPLAAGAERGQVLTVGDLIDVRHPVTAVRLETAG